MRLILAAQALGLAAPPHNAAGPAARLADPLAFLFKQSS
jgi:hypothetical protein